MPNTAKHGFGSSSAVLDAIREGKLNARDILFLDETTNPKVGWIDLEGNPVIVDTEKVIVVDGDVLPETGVMGKIYIFKEDGYFWNGEKFINLCKPTDVTELQEAITALEELITKNAEKAEHTYEKVKYVFTDVPNGTLVNYRESEIRIMCPADAVFTKQSVGTGGDPNCYYGTLKVYVPNDAVVGYIEHLGNQVDSEILTDFSTDDKGRRYQPTWLALAKYDEASDSWTYYGENSTTDKYIGWDYRIDWYNSDGVMIASDSVRINLSNEGCHYTIEPYYITALRSDIEELKENNADVTTKLATITEQVTGIEERVEIVEKETLTFVELE